MAMVLWIAHSIWVRSSKDSRMHNSSVQLLPFLNKTLIKAQLFVITGNKIRLYYTWPVELMASFRNVT